MKATPLREFVNEEIQLLSEKSEQGRPVFRAVFQKSDEQNRNGRVYSKSLWEKVLASPEIKKKLADRTMLGELNHPDYRDPNPNEASHVVTKLWLSEDGKFVYGEAEILDTPKGRILEALLNAGVKIGVSSRGEGQVTERNGVKYVDESSYVLVTFDSVLEPSVVESTASLVESKFGLAMTRMISEGTLGSTEVAVLEKLTEEFEDTELSRTLKAQILEAKNSITNPPKKGKSLMDESKLLDRLEKANNQLSEQKEKLVRVEESNKTLRSRIARLKSEQTKLKERNEKLSAIAKVVPTLKEELEAEKAKVEKAVAVIEGMKKSFDEMRTQKEKVEGFYNKSLEVLEGVTQKINSGKVADYLEEALSEVGGVDRFQKVLGDIETMSLDEAKEKAEEILSLIEDGTVKGYPIESTTKLRLRESSGKKPAERKPGKGSDARASMASILNQM